MCIDHGEDDVILMERVCAGRDPRSFSILFDRYAPRILGVIRKFVRDHHESEDVLQTVFLYVWQHAEVYRPDRGSFEQFLYQVMRSRIKDFFRRNAHVPLAALMTNERETGPDTTGEALEARLLTEDLMSVLSDKERQAIELAIWGGFSQRDIAQILRAPLGSVKSWSRRGMEKIRKRWEEVESHYGTSDGR